MKVTILIAVYNSEQYLNKCLDSLISQTYTNWEAICVDDCSTDTSLSILNKYAQCDKRIKVIHLSENKGQAKARNIAIGQGTGDLFCFLDSDDWYEPDSIRKCVDVFEKNENADCVLFKLIKVWEDGHEEEFANQGVTYSENRIVSIPSSTAFRLSLDWSIHGVYMVRAALQREILYDDTCRTFSDDNTTRLHYLRSREVCIGDGIYYYLQRQGSTSTRTDISRLNFLRANEHMQDMLVKMNASEEILNIHEQVRHQNLIGCYLFFCKYRDSWEKEDRINAEKELKRIWSTIKPERLGTQTHFKFGYMHCPSWTLFKWQEETFYALRVFLGKE